MSDDEALPIEVERANTQHHMVITMDDLKPDEQAEYDALDEDDRRDIDRDRRNIEMECPGVTSAWEGWIECDKSHPDDFGEDWDEEPRAHGQEHQRFEFGWGVQTGQCALLAFPDQWTDSASDLADDYRLGPGRYRIDQDWDDSYVDILLVDPAPDGGGA